MNENETELSFEEALNKLEAIVAQLESGGLPLEQALERFDEAMRLKKQCEALLAQAEARIEELTAVEETDESQAE
ncbi:MAG TPA: exodeoxyribonuclease VII small subunit [Armatimonadota bacterium]|jgi:exodeoxyribonuclease VII small subunit